MTIEVFGHPFAAYCWKVFIAFYENDVPFELRLVEPGTEAVEEHARLWPHRKFPVLREGDRLITESTSIIEYLHVHHRGAVALIPADPDAAIEARMMDRFFDNYVATPQGSIVFNAIREAQDRDPSGDDKARATLDTSYAILDRWMADRQWAAAGQFSLADCAAAPSLFYADWTHPIGDRFPNVAAYRARLLARPSVAKAVDGGRPYRAYFPLGAPDRD